MAAKKRPPPIPAPPLPPSIAAQIADKVKSYQALIIFLTATAAFIGAVWGGLVKVGWDPVVSGTLAEHKSEVGKKIAESDDVLRREFKVTLDTALLNVQKELAALNLRAEKAEREQKRVQMENLDAQEAQIIWQQLPQLTNNLAGIERQLTERAGDTFLLGRKVEVQNAIRNAETRLVDIRARLKDLRERP